MGGVRHTRPAALSVKRMTPGSDICPIHLFILDVFEAFDRGVDESRRSADEDGAELAESEMVICGAPCDHPRQEITEDQREQDDTDEEIDRLKNQADPEKSEDEVPEHLEILQEFQSRTGVFKFF